MNNVEKIKPSGIFTNYIYKAIPLAFDESMSYYETLCGILSLLKTQEEVINNNADLLAELELYVKNYFENLDVQTEINNKLDQMAQDGTLEELIAQYVNLSSVLAYNTVADMKNATNLVNGSFVKTYGLNSLNDGGGAFYKIRNVTTSDIFDNIKIIPINDTLIAELIKNNNIVCFNNVNEMKNATNLVNGSFAKTYGYYNINDGGSAFYKIRNITNDDVIDEKFLLSLSDNTLLAELIYYKDLNIKQIGAKGNNTDDDSSYLQSAINKLATIGGNIIFPNAIYLFNNTITIPDNNETITIFGNNSTFNVILSQNGTFMTCKSTSNYIRIVFNDLHILNNSDNSVEVNGIEFQKVTERTPINNVRINGFYNNILFKNCWNLTINKLVSINASHDGVHCEDVTNAFNFNSCIFTNNENFNIQLTGRGHVFNCCDLSIYKTNSKNKLIGCNGVCFNGCYYEERNNPINPFLIQACRGVSFNGCYFEIRSTAENYKLIDYYNSFGNAIISCGFRSNTTQDPTAYLLYLREGANASIINNDFRDSNKVCYVHNSQLSVDNNKLERVTCFITQNNHVYARIIGNLQNDSDYTNSVLPHKEVVHLIINNIASYGNTASRPTGYYAGQQYYNTQTNHLDIYNGSNWVTS